ncbi:hypothetical protein JW916_02250 [Candidatus Sumerlaeota bacterium]|nr:hypothetical protein [Candidatus Sumerlaeota bacterium]
MKPIGVESRTCPQRDPRVVVLAMVFVLVWGTGAFAVGEVSTETQAVEQPALVFPSLPTQGLVGSSVTLEVRSSDVRALEYRWSVKPGTLGWMMGVWGSSNRYDFVPPERGLYALQVDVRDGLTTEVLVRKWLGQIEVFDGLVKRIVVVPAAASLPVGMSLSFWVEPLLSVPIESLEFRLRTAVSRPGEERSWNVKVPWQDWPLPPFDVPDEAGRSVAIEIDAREKERPGRILTHWMGEKYPHRYERSQANLLRALLSDEFGEMFGDKALLRLADKLNLSVSLLQWEFLGKTANEQRAALERATHVKSVDPGGASAPETRIVLESGVALRFDPAGRMLRQEGSPVSIHLDLASFPCYREAFSRCRDLDEEETHLAALAFAVYEGYEFGIPPDYLLGSIHDSMAHCGAFAFQLHEILSLLGRRVGFAGFDRVGGGAHLFVEAFMADGRSILLDPSAGYVYPFGSKKLGKRGLPQPIVLPQVRDLGFLNVSAIEDPSQYKFISYEEYARGVIPMRQKTDLLPSP